MLEITDCMDTVWDMMHYPERLLYVETVEKFKNLMWEFTIFSSWES